MHLLVVMKTVTRWTVYITYSLKKNRFTMFKNMLSAVFYYVQEHVVSSVLLCSRTLSAVFYYVQEHVVSSVLLCSRTLSAVFYYVQEHCQQCFTMFKNMSAVFYYVQEHCQQCFTMFKNMLSAVFRKKITSCLSDSQPCFFCFPNNCHINIYSFLILS
jgi:hypothetical protein